MAYHGRTAAQACAGTPSATTKGRIDHEHDGTLTVGGLLFSKLIGFDAEGNPKNEVADSIEVNDGNTEYTITLKREGVHRHEVKAENFTRAWSYGANAANAQWAPAPSRRSRASRICRRTG